MSFAVLSSDGTTVYSVTVGMHDGKVQVSCTCRAGELGKLCRHQIGILSGEADLLVAASNEVRDELHNLVMQIANTECAELIAEMLAANVELKVQKKRLDRAKRNLEKLLK